MGTPAKGQIHCSVRRAHSLALTLASLLPSALLANDVPKERSMSRAEARVAQMTEELVVRFSEEPHLAVEVTVQLRESLFEQLELVMEGLVLRATDDDPDTHELLRGAWQGEVRSALYSVALAEFLEAPLDGRDD